MAVKEIPLTRGMTAIVDAADYAIVSEMKWHARKGHNGVFYAGHSAKDGSTILMHRFLMNAEKGEEVDHRDWDGLNNRRKNLRIVTGSQNCYHRKDAKGYYWHKREKRWRAQIGVNKRKIWLGGFPTEALARAAYLNAKKERGYD